MGRLAPLIGDLRGQGRCLEQGLDQVLDLTLHVRGIRSVDPSETRLCAVHGGGEVIVGGREGGIPSIEAHVRVGEPPGKRRARRHELGIRAVQEHRLLERALEEPPPRELPPRGRGVGG